MKSIKPGRGPSGMGVVGSIIAIVFGIFWTVLAASMTAGAGIIGVIFPLFGVLFIVVGIIQAVYNYKNATGKDRYSIVDITDSSEERDPSSAWIKDALTKENENTDETNGPSAHNFCPYCGLALENDYVYCPKCGKTIK